MYWCRYMFVVVVFSFIKQLSNATDTEVTWTIKYKFQINMLKQEQSV